MKKHLLLGAALLATIGVSSQTAKQAIPSGIKLHTAKVLPAELADQNTIQPVNNPGKHTVKNSTNNNAKITAITGFRFSGSMNVLGVLVSESKPLQYNKDLNAITFVHRKSPTYTPTVGGNSGTIVTMFSLNGGTSWDSACVWSHATDFGRYPQGGLYNPLGNTTFTNSYMVVTGPFNQGAGWLGNYYGSKKMTVPGNNAPGTDLQSMNNGSLPAGMRKHHFSRLYFTATDDGKVRSLSQIENNPDGTTYSAIAYRGAGIMKGAFVAGSFSWSIDSIIPSVMTNTPNGYPYINLNAHMAWNDQGTIGYIVFIGTRTGASTAMKGRQPIVYKTTNSGASWSLLPGQDFTTPSFRGLTDRLYPTTGGAIVPVFSDAEGMSAVVDINGNLHLGCTAYGAYSSHNDSLDYSLQFGTNQYSYDYSGSFGYPTIYDFYTTTAGGWNYHIVDSMGTEGPSGTTGYPGYTSNPWTDGSGGKMALDARVQLNRTADGKRIFYSWTESDSTITGLKWNIYPDLNFRGYDVTTDKVTPRMSVTAGSGIATIEQLAYFHYMSNKAISTTTVCFDIPFTITNNPTNNGGIAVDHYYVKGAQVCTSAFTVTPLRPTGIASLANNTPNYEVNLYPNPAGQAVTVSVNLKAATNVEVSVYNSIGQHIQTIPFNGVMGSNDIFMDLSKLNSGVYFYKVKAEGSIVTKKLIIE